VKVLVTGAGGQVGRALVAAAPAGFTLVQLAHAELDITDPRTVSQAVQRHAPDVIINAAAYTAVDRAETEPELAWRANAEGPKHLAAAARQSGARLLHLSTDYVFDGMAWTPYLPAAPTKPLNVYGQTKLAGEQAVMEILPERAIILRTAWVYAAAGRNFVHTMLRVMAAKGSVRVVSDQFGAPTAAGSVAAALWRIVAMPEIVGIHHWTDAGAASWYDFAVAIAEESSALGLISGDITVTPIATREYPTPARRPLFSILDYTSLQALGLVPVHWRRRLRSVLAEIKGG
jgi:dTDP-4-dehydrorhamnose reductase